MSRADSRPSRAPASTDPDIQARELQRECEQLYHILRDLERCGPDSLSWDGTEAGLSRLASQIRQMLGYQAVAIALLDADTVRYHAVDPPNVEIAAQLLDPTPQNSDPYSPPQVKDTVVVPLVSGAQCIGLVVIVLESVLIPYAIDLWRLLGSRITSAITAGQLRSEVQHAHRRIVELDLLNEVSQAASLGSLNEILHVITQRIAEAFQARRCAVFLRDKSTDHVVLRAAYNLGVADDHTSLTVSLADRPHIAAALDTSAPAEIVDVFADDRLRAFWDRARELDIEAQLAIPLIAGQGVIGVLGIDRAPSTPPFDKTQVDLLGTIARQATHAIENVRRHEDAHNRAERLWLANMVSRDIGTQLDIHQLLWDVARLIRETFDCYYVAVGMIENSELVFRAGINYLYQIIPDLCLPLLTTEPTVAARVARQGRSSMIRDVREEPHYKALPGREDTRSQLSVPLKVPDRAREQTKATDYTVGVLDVGSTEVGAFSEEDLQLLEALAAQVSVAVENARLFGRVQEEHATLDAIINGTNDAIVITDSTDHILFFNPAAQHALSNGKMLQPGSLLSEAAESQAFCTFWEDASQHEVHSAEIPLADGQTLYASVTTVQDVGKVAVMQDITYLKELDRVKSEFVSTVSHDLRSPLQVIQSSAELIPRVGEINQEQRRQVDHILAVVRRISDLVQNLLDIGRIEAGVGMDVQPCAIDEIIAHAAGSCRSLAQDRGLEFVIDVPHALPMVKANPLRLEQVITNLVINAIKFTPEGSVTVVARGNGDGVVLEVQDTGIGIPLEVQDKLFGKFYRVKSPETRGIPGTGLGLAIVKSIVESYGGRVELESFPRLGSTFRVVLPAYTEMTSTT